MTSRLLIPFAVLATAAACTTPAPPADAEHLPSIAVTAVRATAADWSADFEAGGIVRSRITSAIASRVMAPVNEVHVRAGDRVRRGAPLVTLDSRELTANRERAAASAAAAQESSAAADADVTAAEAGLALAKATHERIAGLAAKHSATPQELDQAVAALTSADAQLRSAQARRAAAGANRDAARAAGAAADAGASYAQITAPFDGVISARLIDPGAMATPGTPLLMLEDLGSLRLEVRVDEARAGQIQVGQTIDVSLDRTTDDKRPWMESRVVEVDQLDPASHAFVVKADVPSGITTRSGAFGRARFRGDVRKTLTVPDAAIVRRGQLAFVFAVDSENTARLRAISPGATAGGRTEALAGLADGDLVVVNPPAALVDGQAVDVRQAPDAGDRR